MPSAGSGGDCGMKVGVAGCHGPTCLPEDGPLCAASASLSIVLGLSGSSRLAISRERARLGTLEIPLSWVLLL